MRSKSGRRQMGMLVLGCLAVTAAPLACRDTGTDTERGASGAATGSDSRGSTPAAGADVTALLDGLGVGDSVAGYQVTWIGAVREDGGVALRLEQGGRRMRLALALDTQNPRPPVRTEKYALYFEDTQRRDGASEEDCARVLEALAKRIRKVEHRVSTPTGMGALPAPAATM